MDVSSQNKKPSSAENSAEPQSLASPSFKQTYEGIEALWESKIAKLITSKNLIAAEVKLSFSAILLALAIALGLTLITTAVWILLNFGAGLIVMQLTQSIAIALTSLITVNILLGLWLFKQLKQIWRLVGVPAALSAFNQNN
ncbi:hypothetical protein FGD67_10485 [Colwellia sp. M166]|jgi:hypothetical protein|uniref:hypothetical protein n=1 Tax=Colwellia sp. M166 TaxID=2583805 RepID=UPI00211E1BE0|nr:hypothetical protein [Colwellia sp. M166]UUO23610.1 hypothetical protein FGD67_10485 [Colwellia sp. M166]|tara:strand:+ start:970 stop:1395 length:426 start_codon:yes stop_codon:yes gene_type:complete